MTNDHVFKDAHYFYRFKEDDPFEKKLSRTGPSVAALLSECGVSMKGWVKKKGLILWNKRYMVLKADESMLYYFTSNLDPSPRQAVTLDATTSVREAPNMRRGHYCFEVVAPDEVYSFACKSSKEQEKWIEELLAAGAGYQEEDSSHVTAQSLFEFSARDVDGEVRQLSEWKGNVVLVVNVASK